MGAYYSNYGKTKGNPVNPFVRLYDEKVRHQNGVGVFRDLRQLIDNLISSEEPTTMLLPRQAVSMFPEYHCLIKEIPPPAPASYLSYAFSKNSPYYEIFNYALLKLSEKGVVRLLNQRFVNLDVECLNDGRDESLSFVKLISLFGILGAGTFLALVLFIAESIFRHQHLSMHFERPNAMLNYRGNKLYLKELEKFMFKWGMGDQTGFLSDYERLQSFKAAISKESIVSDKPKIHSSHNQENNEHLHADDMEYDA